MKCVGKTDIGTYSYIINIKYYTYTIFIFIKIILFSGQDTRRLVPEEISFEPQTNIIDNEQTAIISENNDVLAFSEEPYNDQNSVYNSSEMPDDSSIFENTFLITSESPIKPTPSHSSEITGRRIINLMHFIKQI